MNLSKGWIRATQFALACAGVLMIQTASAQAAFPLVCQGGMNLKTNGPTNFLWSMAAASTTPPGSFECAWLDRAPRGSELITMPNPPPGHPEKGNTLVSKVKCSNLQNSLGTIALQVNQYIEVMVSQNPTTHNMDVQSWVGLVTPSFPAAPVEFRPSKPCT
jgi:hypothetical protein